jgi:chromosome segregation ATPase
VPNENTMSDEEGTRSRRSSISGASSGGSELAREIAVMRDRLDAAEAELKHVKEKFNEASQSNRGFSTSLKSKTKVLLEAKQTLLSRNAFVKSCTSDPEVMATAKLIKESPHMQAILEKLDQQAMTLEQIHEYTDHLMQAAAAVLKSNDAQKASYEYAKDEQTRAQQAFDDSKAKMLELEGLKKDAEEKIERLKKENEDLTNPVLDDDVMSGSDGSPANGMSLCSGKRPATELKPAARKRRAGDGLHG